MHGKFITLEGIDGAGKSTQLNWLADFFRQRRIRVVVTREPGGTALGEKLRALLLDKTQARNLETEALLMFAARREHIDQIIAPALGRGDWVICDRFTDATFAYQGSGSGVDWARLRTLEQWVQGGLQPDLTILFDVAPEVGRKRAGSIKTADRFEQEKDDFFARVREGYLRRARENSARMRVIDAGAGIEEIRGTLREIVEPLCP
ncbi:MAG: dTMP kinase [Burkholderiales bacterium]